MNSEKIFCSFLFSSQRGFKIFYKYENLDLVKGKIFDFQEKGVPTMQLTLPA